MESINAQDLYFCYQQEEIDFFRLWEVFRNKFKHLYFRGKRFNHLDEISELDYQDNKPIELSVIIPVRNVEKYLKRYIDTILIWENDLVEFLFIEQGSRDQTPNIIEEAIKRDPRIKIYYVGECSTSYAREYGLQKAAGYFVGFFNPVDYVDPYIYKELLSRALSGNYDVTWCGYNKYDDQTGSVNRVDDLNGWPFDYGVINKEIIDTLIAYHSVAVCSAIYKNKFLIDNNIHFINEVENSDIAFKVKTMASASSVASIEKYLYNYQINTRSNDYFENFVIFKDLDLFFADRNEKQKVYYKIVKKETHKAALITMDEKSKKKYKKMMKGAVDGN